MNVVVAHMPVELKIPLMLLSIACDYAWVGWGLTLLALLGLRSKSEWMDRVALGIALVSGLLNGLTAVGGLLEAFWIFCVSAVSCLVSYWCVHRWLRFASKGY